MTGRVFRSPHKEVSGLTVEVETETFHEGGVNGYEHKLPKRVKYPNLTLKRALQKVDVSQEKTLQKWQQSVFNSDFALPVELQDIIIKLMDAEGNPLRTWTCKRAYPLKIETAGFDAEKNQVAIETMEFCYKQLT